MRAIVDDSLRTIGIHEVVYALVDGLTLQQKLPLALEQKFLEVEQMVLGLDLDSVANHPFTQGYQDLILKVGQKLRKYPPSVYSFIKNIQRKGFIPRINPIVDIYNMNSLKHLLAIGGHDFHKIQGDVTFTLAKEACEFYPIFSDPIHVKPTDFIYRDEVGILAFCGVRDGHAYRIEEGFEKGIFIIQGNQNTSVQVRLDCLKEVCHDFKVLCPNCMVEYHRVNEDDIVINL